MNNVGFGLRSHTYVCSIIGDEALNCRVRNGAGCTRLSMEANKVGLGMAWSRGHVVLPALQAIRLSIVREERKKSKIQVFDLLVPVS